MDTDDEGAVGHQVGHQLQQRPVGLEVEGGKDPTPVVALLDGPARSGQ